MGHPNSISLYYIAIWFAYLIFAPFYLFQSGYPQPADGLIVMGLIPAFFLFFLNTEFKITPVFLAGALFVGLTFSINITHFFFAPDKKFLLSSLYYIYNFGVFLFVSYLFSQSPKKINRVTYIALAGSIVLELLIVLFEYGQEIRSQGSFNNPNQLGYWSLLSFALLIIIKRGQKLNYLDSFLIIAVFATQIMSLSKAGIISMLFCMIILFFSKIITNYQRAIAIFLVLVATAYIIIFNTSVIRTILTLDTIEAAYTRLSTIGSQGDDSLSGRGYDRIIQNPHYLLLGAGEGANWRYSPQGKELHSGLATLVFSYGIVGFITFFIFLFFAFRGRPWRYTLLLIPIMLYGLTHQNVRFTYFWVVVAAAYSGRYFNHDKEILLPDDSDIGETPPRQEAS